MNEQQLYKFCIENVHNLINGNLSIAKIKKLRDIGFSFDNYIDDYISVKSEEL